MTNPLPPDTLPAEDWAGPMGERWLAHLDRFESMIAPVGEALLARAAFVAGERVVDVGCGGGATTAAIAAQVAPTGYVVGVDISAALIDEARARADRAGLDNVRFVVADAAQAQLPQAPFDRLFSRFGTMFFPEPQAAFGNLASWLRPGGRADFSVWAPAKDNPWVAELMQIVRRYVELPPPVPRAPGPFALDDPNYCGELLRNAGFVELRFELWQGVQLVGGAQATAAEAAHFALHAMSFGDALKEADPSTLAAAERDLRTLFAAHEGPHGVRMPATAWLVSAIRA